MNTIKPLLIEKGKYKNFQKKTSFSERYHDLLSFVFLDDEKSQAELSEKLESIIEKHYYSPSIEDSSITLIEGIYFGKTGLAMQWDKRVSPELMWVDSYGNLYSGDYADVMAQIPNNQIHPIFDGILTAFRMENIR